MIAGLDIRLDDQISVARAKKQKHFLEPNNGVGATDARPYIANLVVTSSCFWCSDGYGTCLGTSCMGPKTEHAKESPVVHVKVESRFPIGYGGYSSNCLTGVVCSTWKRKQIAALKYPCYLPPFRQCEKQLGKSAKKPKSKVVLAYIFYFLMFKFIKVKLLKPKKDEAPPRQFILDLKTLKRILNGRKKKKPGSSCKSKVQGSRWDRPEKSEISCKRKINTNKALTTPVACFSAEDKIQTGVGRTQLVAEYEDKLEMAPSVTDCLPSVAGQTLKPLCTLLTFHNEPLSRSDETVGSGCAWEMMISATSRTHDAEAQMAQWLMTGESIKLTFKLVQVGLCVRDPSTGPDWFNALVNLFTVVEFPKLGYQPPAVLTKIHFQVDQRGLESSSPNITPVRGAICLGKVGISCSLLDTTADASVSINVEEAAVYLSKDLVLPVNITVCLADLSVTMSEPEHYHLRGQGLGSFSLVPLEPTLLVTSSANLVRVRTSADTLQLLAELWAGFAGAANLTVEISVDGSDVTQGQTSEDMLHDIEDAMMESSIKKTSAIEKEKPIVNTARPGEVFYFPGEGDPSSPSYSPNIPSSAPDLTQIIIYLPQSSLDMIDEESSNLESVCILEEGRSDIVPSGGQFAIKSRLDGGVNNVDNNFNVPQAVINHLKSPKRFPLPQSSLVWQIFGGNDFSSSKVIMHKVQLEQMGLSLIPKGFRSRTTMNVNNGMGSAISAADYLKTRECPGWKRVLLIEVIVVSQHKVYQHEVYLLVEVANSPVTTQIVLYSHFEGWKSFTVSILAKIVSPLVQAMRHPFVNSKVTA